MKGNPTASLKWSALVFGVLWSGWMLWWSGSIEIANCVVLAVCGGVVGISWFVAMRFIFQGSALSPPDGRPDKSERRRGKLAGWMVWTALMSLSGVATACLLDLIGPLFPSGWQWLISSLFVVTVWPALMWSLRPLMKHHLPA